MPVFLCSIVLLADSPVSRLTVEVQSANSGKPVERASVVVKFVKGRAKMKLGTKIRTTWETKTDQTGHAKIPTVPRGTVQVQVIASNYQTFGGLFDLDEDEKTITIKLNPPQAQYTAH